MEHLSSLLFVKIAGMLLIVAILVGWLLVPYARDKSDVADDYLDDMPGSRHKSHNANHDDMGD
ncbi:MAG: hypothetical protein LBS89_04820 [Zoogloeaceae bacterium]|jgi:hypothetical protein|nr:hypothetical protein [Zoogloeaceae bacterium]